MQVTHTPMCTLWLPSHFPGGRSRWQSQFSSYHVHNQHLLWQDLVPSHSQCNPHTHSGSANLQRLKQEAVRVTAIPDTIA